MNFLKLNKAALIALGLTLSLYSCKKEKPTQTETLDRPESLSVNPLGDIKICTERSLDGTTPRGAVLKSTKWTVGTTIKVSLNGSTSAIRNKVIQYAREWEKYANIKFNFVTNDNTAKIRVSFVSGDGSWSYIGKSTPSTGATMNFGWLTASTADSEYSRVVIHEFGHALGMIHEHQHPLVSITRQNTVGFQQSAHDFGIKTAKIAKCIELFEVYVRQARPFIQTTKHSVVQIFLQLYKPAR